jgi:hypothetical protein
MSDEKYYNVVIQRDKLVGIVEKLLSELHLHAPEPDGEEGYFCAFCGGARKHRKGCGLGEAERLLAEIRGGIATK